MALVATPRDDGPGLSTRRLGRRPVLDGLRGVAVLLVISEHTGLVHNGFMGVDLFFVLSGFLITTLLCEEWERRGGISLKAFYVRRARRLLPALALLAVLAVVVELLAFPLAGWSLGVKLATTFAFVNNWVAGLGHSQALGALNPTWSLAQEEQFYLLWPVVLLLLLRLRVEPRLVLALLVGLIAAALLVEPSFVTHLNGYSRYYDPIDRAAELLMGCATSLVWRQRMIALPEAATPQLRLGAWRRSAVELATAGLAFAFAWLYLKTNPVHDRWVFLGAAAIAVPAIVLLIQAPRTLVGRLVGLAPLRAVGRLSYSVYLIHLLVRNLVQHYVPEFPRPWEVAAMTLAVSLPVAGLSYRYIESPIRSGRWPVPLGQVISAIRGGELSIGAGRNGRSPQAAGRPIRSTA